MSATAAVPTPPTLMTSARPVGMKTINIMKVFVPFLMLMLSLSSASHSQSVFSEKPLEDPAQLAMFKELAAELRCLVCQNQNIADSNAPLAQDLRREIHTMISRGDTKSQIIDFMVQRYGEFVLYRPRFTTKTLVLWVGPFLLFLMGLGMLWMQSRKPRAPVATDSESLAAARELLQAGQNKNSKSS